MNQRYDYLKHDRPDIYEWLANGDRYAGTKTHPLAGETAIKNYYKTLRSNLIENPWQPSDPRLYAMQERWIALASRMELVQDLLMMAERKTSDDVFFLGMDENPSHGANLRSCDSIEASLAELTTAEGRLDHERRHERILDMTSVARSNLGRAWSSIHRCFALRELNEMYAAGVDINYQGHIEDHSNNRLLRAGKELDILQNALRIPVARKTLFKNTIESLADIQIQVKKIQAFAAHNPVGLPNDGRHAMDKQCRDYCSNELLPEVARLAKELKSDIKNIHHWMGYRDLHHAPDQNRNVAILKPRQRRIPNTEIAVGAGQVVAVPFPLYAFNRGR